MRYYPLVHPPRNMLFEAALYWDGITSMVPGGAGQYESYLVGDDLALLKDAGLYRPTYLSKVLRGHELNEIISDVSQLTATMPAGDFDPPTRMDMYSRLWSGKVPAVVESYLLAAGLLRPNPENELALLGDPRLLMTLMSTSADYASASLQEEFKQFRFVPATSDAFAHVCATDPLVSHPSGESLMLDVGGILPIPAPETPIEHILAFRARYADERTRCMEAVRKLHVELRRNEVHPREVELEMRSEIERSLRDLRRAGQETFRWAAGRTVWITLAVVGGTVAGGPLGGAIAAATGIAINMATQPARVRDERFSYIHQFETHFA